MTFKHRPPAGIKDFDRGTDPASLYGAWDTWMSGQLQPSGNFPAWYDSASPPVQANPVTAAPPWQGLPKTAVLLNGQDVLAASSAVEEPVEFANLVDPLLVKQPPFLNAAGQPVPGFKYRPQDEYLEWVALKDSDGVIREILFTCEGPEYWKLLAEKDRDLAVTLYAELLAIPAGEINPDKLYFRETLTHKEPFAGGDVLTFPKGSYNPYNEYNIAGAVHLTQGANTLGAEIALAMSGSLIWGNPPKTQNPELICCALYGEPNRASDPTIGKEVNDLARQGNYVTLRDPVGLYIGGIIKNDFTDWNGQPIPNVDSYFVPLRKSDDGSMILRASFRVPAGVMRNGVQARVGDLQYLGRPITKGGQVANAVTMHLFAQALPGAPGQGSQTCQAHACSDPNHPGFIIPTAIGTPCQPPHPHGLRAHLASVQPQAASHATAPAAFAGGSPVPRRTRLSRLAVR